MDCRTAEGMVSRYLNHTLTIEELEAFLEHVKSCSSCYEELETYFIVQEAMQKLDTAGREGNLDFKNLLEEDLQRAEKHVQRRKLLRFLAILLICLLTGTLLVLFIFIVMEIRAFI